jgi:cytidyltransferase-like protein
MTRVYMDGVFDLFHRGHVESINKCLKFGDELIIGVVSDKDAESYKRIPIINELDRAEIIKNLKVVNEVIFPAPLTMTKKFIVDNKIDIIVHSFSNNRDFEIQKDFFKVPIDMGIFKKIDYYDKVSTTDIIKRIVNRSYSI